MRYPVTAYRKPSRAGDIRLSVDYESLSRLREVFLTVMIAVSVLCFISLFEYQPGVNHGIAYAMILSFGAMRYIAAVVFGYFGITLYLHWNRLQESQYTLILKFVGLALVFLSTDFVFGENADGGLLGNWLVGMLQVDEAIAVVLVACAFVCGMLLMTRLSWYHASIFSYHFCRTFLFFKTKMINRRSDRVIESDYLESTGTALSVPPKTTQPQLLLNDPMANQLANTLRHFGIESIVSGKEIGSVFTRYEVHLAPGVKSSAVVNLKKDIARSLLVSDVKVVEVIPGKNCIGVELENKNREICHFSDMQYQLDDAQGGLPILLGKTSSNDIRVVDLEKMPHLLIAGGTGSGKTMLLQSILMSLTSQLTQKELRVILIDCKRIAFAAWKNLPHLLTDIVTETSDAISLLNWCVGEMENRYKMLAQNPHHEFYKVVVIIDEFADLITTHKLDIENAVTRLSQKARQSGIHLVLATQRPTVDVITGQIRANILTRVALSVADKRESRIVLENSGAESLLGQGDMLFKSNDRQCERIHAPFVSDDFIAEHVASLKSDREYRISDESENDIAVEINPDLSEKASDTVIPINFESYRKPDDTLFDAAVALVKKTGTASASAIQSHFNIGYPRALKIMDAMQEKGIIGKRLYHNGPREVLSA